MKKLAVLLFLLFSVAVYAQENSVIVTGFGETVDEAKRNAFVTAIEQSMGVMVSSDILIENGELIRDKIRSQSEGFIESYTVISTGRDKQLYVVTIRATVAEKKLRGVLEEITHVNDAQLAYDAVKCSYMTFDKKSIMCRSGDLAIGNMNFGIYMDSYALLRYYTSEELTEAQLYLTVTLRDLPGFNGAVASNGDKLEFKHGHMIGRTEELLPKTVTRDYIIVFGNNLDYLRKNINAGLEIKLRRTFGDVTEKEITVKVPAAYIEGFVNFIDDNFYK